MSENLMTDFVHLHVHSHYSLLEAIPKLDALLNAAVADGQKALALTDNGNLYGAIEFIKECKKREIKPILGVDFFVAPRTRHDKEHNVDDHAFRLVLIVKNMVGYHNLLKLVSLSFTEGFHLRPRLDRELIEKYHEGLIAILPSFDGETARAVKDHATDRAHESLSWYKKLFGDDCYVEITHHPEVSGHEASMKEVIKLARELDVPLVAANDVYYLTQDDDIARELVMKIRNGGTLNRDEESSNDFSFITREQAKRLFADTPDALKNTVKIAEMCEIDIMLGKGIFPVFPIPEGTSDNIELRTMAEAGYAMRGLERTEKLVERMNYELGIIEKKGYSSYFLIVADLMRFSREAGIYTNTRGSAAGSFVSYLCGITTVDPVAFNLPFERFLNPLRPSAPDIDMDIASDRRDDLIDYARSVYGEDHVAQIGTFGTMAARAAVRDVARALGHSYGIGDRISKMIPIGKQGSTMTYEKALEETPELKEAYDADPTVREVIDLAKKVEGNSRHIGVHAAGVVIAPESITNYTPIQPDPKGGKTISQYDMYSICDEYMGVGLVKFDFLGLANLMVLAKSVERVRERLGITLDLDRIPLDDKKVYEMLTRGETLGVFQMAGAGMTGHLKDLKPTVIHDLNAMVALYRPGPMNFIPDYIARKQNPKLVTYLDPRLESILKDSYGIITYQDDVLYIAIQLAGYDWLEADKFRKAIGKKIADQMAAQKEKFFAGCIAGGMKEGVVTELWQQIETFAAYGFNKAHASSYGNLAYKTAYMKANYSVDYMAAILTADAGDVEKIAEIVGECKRMGISILPPSINESFGTYTVVDNTSIRLGLYSIKNFGTGVSDSIIAARKEGGRFTDLSDFLARVPDKNLNKKSLEALIMCGAMDDFGERGQLMANIETLLEHHRGHTKAPSDQGSLFGALAAGPTQVRLKPAEPANMDQKLAWEKELLGLYVSGHPLDKHAHKFANAKNTIKFAKENLQGADTVIAGYLNTTQTILTKKGDKMMFGQLVDTSDMVGIEITIFPRILAENPTIFTAGTCIAIKGKLNERNGTPSFVVDRVKKL